MDNGQKIPLARALESFAQRKAVSAIGLIGKSLPASVVTVVSSGIVTVKFELTNLPFTLPNVTVPIFGSEYYRLPVQAGIKGAVMAFDAYLGGMTGLGGGTADLTPRPNLSDLCFVPLGSRAWANPIDPNSAEIYGVGSSGVILRDGDNVCQFKLTSSGLVITINGVVVFQVAASAVTIPEGLQLGGTISSKTGGLYAGDIHTGGTVTADTNVVGGGKSLATHVHGGVSTGGGDTGPPV